MSVSLRNRLISGVIGIALLFVLFYLRGLFIIIPAFVIAIIGLIEFNRAFKNINYNPLTVPTVFIAIFLMYIYVFDNAFDYKLLVMLLLISFLVLLCYYVLSAHEIVDVMVSSFSLIYVVFPMILIMKLSSRNDYFLYLGFFIAIASDVGAYFVGKKYGKHKLIPKVSPNKTIEGAIGGLIFSVLSTVLFKVLLIPEMSFQAAIILGLIGSFVSQIGDLSASKIKRYTKIKDFGKLIPGHGGILDRFDSILFTSALVFMYVWVFYQ